MTYTNGISGAQQSAGIAELPGPDKTAGIVGPNTGTQSGTASTAATDGDQATLSATAGLLAQALSANDSRLEKVANLQQHIASGTYSVPASDVAGSIVNSLLG